MKEEQRLFNKFGRTFPAGTVLFEEGQTCAGMYIIQTGRVRLFKKCGAREMTIDILGEGDFFGEMACLIGKPRSINAVVEEGSHILLVDPKVLDELFRENSGMGLRILGNLANRLKKAYEIIKGSERKSLWLRLFNHEQRRPAFLEVRQGFSQGNDSLSGGGPGAGNVHPSKRKSSSSEKSGIRGKGPG